MTGLIFYPSVSVYPLLSHCPGRTGFPPETERHHVQPVRPLRIARSDNEGRGVFTGAFIPSGLEIVTIEGPLKSSHELTDPYEEARSYQIGPGLHISPNDPYGPFINHSCDPNCGIRIRGAVAVLVAIRDIGAGEELVFDYSILERDGHWQMDCACRSPACRRMIGEFKDLPPDLQRRYIVLGIVSDYVRGTASP